MAQSLGGSQAVTLNWGTVAAIAAWAGALLNTSRLEDKMWFVVLLPPGLFRLGWLAMIAHVFAGPASTRREATASAGVASA
jgi:hypothetical protein